MNRYIKIALLVSIAVVSAVSFFYLITDQSVRGDTYEVVAYLEDATGLLPNSKVRIYGVVVGSVQEISIADGLARVIMHLSGDSVLYEDAIFEKRTESLIGTSSVMINPGTPQKRKIEPGGQIRTVQSGTALERTFSTLGEFSAIGDSIFEELMAHLTEDQIKAREGQISAAMSEIVISLQHFNRVMQNISTLSDSIEKRSGQDLEQMAMLMEQITILSAGINRLIAANEQTVNSSMQEMQRGLSALADQIETVGFLLDDISDAVSAVNQGEGSIGKLLRDDQLYESVIRLTAEAERTMQSTLGIDLELDYQGNYLFKQGAMRNKVGISVLPRSGNKHYSIAVVDTPGGGQTTVTTRRITEDSVESVETVQETVGGWVPDLQLAYYFGPMIVRGGLIEGAGGIGLDYLPLDLASLSLEAFDFNGEFRPNLRLRGELMPFARLQPGNPLRWIYLNGGIEQILSPEEQGFYFGAGLRFIDNDLKGVMSVAPLAR